MHQNSSSPSCNAAHKISPELSATAAANTTQENDWGTWTEGLIGFLPGDLLGHVISDYAAVVENPA